MNREESAIRVDRVVITGGAGFIGSNTAEHYLRAGARVTILDNFSRRGSESNAKWLQQSSPPGRLTIVRVDHDTLSRAIDGVDVVFHLAAQVAVTTSVTNPREDFESPERLHQQSYRLKRPQVTSLGPLNPPPRDGHIKPTQLTSPPGAGSTGLKHCQPT
jgi:uncharacterized protein YbjT (DUF2867 family)